MEQQIKNFTSIHPDTAIGKASLKVANLERSLDFYQRLLGFEVIEQTPTSVFLGAQDGPVLLEIHEVQGAIPQPSWSTGLYHIAILLPSRAYLGKILLHLAEAGIELGQADHLVSEALYLSDPDGNGLEIYRDRPRAEWQWSNGSIKMATDPLDIRAIVEEGRLDGQAWSAMPKGTRIGHMHLKVGDIPQAEHFYHDILGFDIIFRMPSALFVSAGGYHHHIGMNIWESRGAGPAPESSAGLRSFVITLPNKEALKEVQARLQVYGVTVEEQGHSIVVYDPWQNEVILSVMESV